MEEPGARARRMNRGAAGRIRSSQDELGARRTNEGPWDGPGSSRTNQGPHAGHLFLIQFYFVSKLGPLQKNSGQNSRNF